VDSAVQKAEGVSAPDGYFQTFGSAVANRIARQKLAPQKEVKRFSWGWITAAAALASLAIVLVSGDLTKPRLYRAVPEEQKAALSQAPAMSQPPAADAAKDPAPAPSLKSLETAPELNLAEAPAEAAKDEAPAQETRKMEAASEMDLAEVSMEKEAPAAAPAKRAQQMEAAPEMNLAKVSMEKAAPTAAPAQKAKLMDLASSRTIQPVGSAGMADKKDQAAKPAAVQTPVKLASAPVSLMPSQAGPSSVESVTVIEICLPDDGKDCPEPQIRSAIQINLGGI
jgi:hypothetical protein